MRILHLILALLIASASVGGGLYLFVDYRTAQVQKELSQVLVSIFPGKLRYNVSNVQHEMGRLKVSLDNVVVDLYDPSTVSRVVYRLDSASLMVDLWGATSYAFELPKESTLTYSFAGRDGEYRLLTDGATLKVSGVSDQVVWSAEGFVLQNRGVDGYVPALSGDYVYLQRSGYPKLFTASVSKLMKGEDELLESLSLSTRMKLSGELSLPYLLASLFEGSVLSDHVLAKKIFKDVSKGGAIELPDVRLVKSGDWYAFSGDVVVDAEGYLDGSLSVSTNKFDESMTFLRGVVKRFPLALERMLIKLSAQGSVNAFRVSGSDGKMYINGSPAGEMKPLIELIGHGR